MRFIDEVKIDVYSGDGGAGASTFRREKFIPFGGPDGGDGGRGGHIYFVGRSKLNTLLPFRGRKVYKACHGEHGRGHQKFGHAGEDLFLEVPMGTQIKDSETGVILLDVLVADEPYLFLEGGIGGLGNVNFKSSTNQAPRYAQTGRPGIHRELHLELKLLADFGLLGLPNAGKSTLLSRISKANPKIADYPFTTLVPQLGVANYQGETFTIVDLPGPIEGAAQGLGLGHRFLKHLERNSFLIHLIDATISDDPFDVFEQYRVIHSELEQFSQKLLNKFEIVALTKIDALSVEQIESLTNYFEEQLGKKIIPISAHSGLNMDRFLALCLKLRKKYTSNQIEEENGTKQFEQWVS